MLIFVAKSMSHPKHISSIPLPSQEQAPVMPAKKSAREMLQEALQEKRKSSKNSDKSLSSSDKANSSIKPNSSSRTEVTPAIESSQTIVDELFKDFIAQKLNKPPSVKDSVESDGLLVDSILSATGPSVDEMSKILDMEINSIQVNSGIIKDSDDKTGVSNNKHEKSSKSSKHRKKSKSSKRSRSDKSPNSSDRSRKKRKESSSQSSSAVDLSASEEIKTVEDSVTPVFSNVSLNIDNTCEMDSMKDTNEGSVVSITAKSAVNKLPNTVLTNLANKETANAPNEVKELSQNSELSSMPLSENEKIESALSNPPQLAQPPELPKAGVDNTSETQSSDTANLLSSAKSAPGLMLPNALAKKQVIIPKQLGLKLTENSLSLIQSKDRVDGDGRVWEEGELHSSQSEEGGAESDSDQDDDPSETGSIHSEEGKKDSSHKSKKKHKHKHKKKKKKSSNKDKDKEKNSDSAKDDKNNGDKTNDESKTRKRSRSKERKQSKSTDDSKRSEKSKHKEISTEKDGKDSERSKQGKDSDKTRHTRSRSRSRHKSRSPKHRRSHSRSRSPKRGHYDEWDARHYFSRSGKTSRHRSRSQSPSRDRSRRKFSRERNRETREQRLQIDKAKLREIAIANAMINMKSTPGIGIDMPAVLTVQPEQSGKPSGKSVQELTDFCKKISAKEEDSEVSDSEDENVAQASDEDDTLIHHPFKIKEPPSSTSIVMNIRNSKQIPIQTPLEKRAEKANLRLAFPVSSGSHHRASESEWVPVERPTTQPAASTTASKKSSTASSLPPPTAPAPVANIVEEPPQPDESIFPDPVEAKKIDIGTIISERLQAVRKLQENPYDVQALSSMHKAQERANQWAASKHLPGQFTGTTGAKILSQAELAGDKKNQAWAKKTQLSQAAPVSGGIGMALLQKMGWRAGEGLGKNNEGNKEPLLLDVKVDRKGLTTSVENPNAKVKIVPQKRAKDLSNKHPVSALMELCNRRKWGPPAFTVVDESGPDHKKNFLFKVKVNNVEYQPAVPSSNKKMAKAQCAAICLQEMGLLPRDAPINI